MKKQHLRKQQNNQMSINLGKGPYVQTASQTDTKHFLVAQKPFEII